MTSRRSRGWLPAKVAGASLAAGVVLLSLASGARSTTGIDPLISVSVRVSDTGIVVKPSRVTAGQTVDMRVVNVGKRIHDFRISGLKTPPLAHRQVAHVVLSFFGAGRYLYFCKLHCTAKMRGYVTVRANL
jgi:plastocyanin